MTAARFTVAMAAGVLAAATLVAAQGNPEAAKVRNPVAATPESIAAGKQVDPISRTS
jgi:hypothetical protein